MSMHVHFQPSLCGKNTHAHAPFQSVEVVGDGFDLDCLFQDALLQSLGGVLALDLALRLGVLRLLGLAVSE